VKSKPAAPPASLPYARDTRPEFEPDLPSQNIETILEFYSRDEQKISRSQRILERISRFVGHQTNQTYCHRATSRPYEF
jgi:hypothetical protein